MHLALGDAAGNVLIPIIQSDHDHVTGTASHRQRSTACAKSPGICVPRKQMLRS
jgi:hypothetical protein